MTAIATMLIWMVFFFIIGGVIQIPLVEYGMLYRDLSFKRRAIASALLVFETITGFVLGLALSIRISDLFDMIILHFGGELVSTIGAASLIVSFILGMIIAIMVVLVIYAVTLYLANKEKCSVMRYIKEFFKYIFL